MIYGLRRMIYLLRKCDIISVSSYAKRISSAQQISYPQGISPVPTGTDIIEKDDCCRNRLFHGGGEGNRTPVRKQLGGNFSGRSLLFTFPYPVGNKHPAGFGSFMMRGMGKAYHTHGLHSNHTRARLVDLPGRMGA